MQLSPDVLAVAAAQLLYPGWLQLPPIILPSQKNVSRVCVGAAIVSCSLLIPKVSVGFMSVS